MDNVSNSRKQPLTDSEVRDWEIVTVGMDGNYQEQITVETIRRD